MKNTTQKIKHFGSCDSHNLIYAVRCKKCNELYVGHTGEKLQVRMSKHRYDCKRRPDNTELSAHFHRGKHDPEKDMEIFILQTGLKTVEEREFQEDCWIADCRRYSQRGSIKTFTRTFRPCTNVLKTSFNSSAFPPSKDPLGTPLSIWSDVTVSQLTSLSDATFDVTIWRQIWRHYLTLHTVSSFRLLTFSCCC